MWFHSACHGAGRARADGTNVGSSADRSRDRGHHAPSTYPEVGAFGFKLSREVCRGGSAASAAERVARRVRGPNIMLVLPSTTAKPGRVGVAENDASLTAHTRNTFDTLDGTPPRS